MTGTRKIISLIGVALVALVFVVIIGAILLMRTDWFRGFVREKIIATTEDSTGGKVEIGSFDFDWSHMRATITDFVIHGTEPAGAAPPMSARPTAAHPTAMTSAGARSRPAARAPITREAVSASVSPWRPQEARP